MADAGADPRFQVRGGVHLKRLRRAVGGAKIFGVFRLKNHIFSNFRGARPGCAPLPGSAPVMGLVGNMSPLGRDRFGIDFYGLH